MLSLGLSEYIVVALILLTHDLLQLDAAWCDLKACRAREAKVRLRKKIKRNKKNVLLCAIWPVRLIRALYGVISSLKKL